MSKLQNRNALAKAIDIWGDFAFIATHPLLRPLARSYIFTVRDFNSCLFYLLCWHKVEEGKTFDHCCVDASFDAHWRAIARFARFWHGIPFVPAFWHKMEGTRLRAHDVIIGFRVSGAPTAIALRIDYGRGFRVLTLPLKNGYAQNVPPLPQSLTNSPWCYEMHATVLDGEGKTLDATIFAHNAVPSRSEYEEISRTDFNVFLKYSSEEMRKFFL